MKSSWKRSLLCSLCLAFSVQSACALLPDPGNIYYGIARDVFGVPYQVGSSAKVVMLRVVGTLDDPFDQIADDDIILAESSIIGPAGSLGVNYVLRPSQDDAASGNRYLASAARVGDSVRLFIMDGGIRYAVASAGGCAPVSDPVPDIGLRGTLKEVNIRAIDDGDGDCIADSWEAFFLGDTGFDQTQDFDLDGFNNLAEFLGGTNPLLPDSMDITLENLGLRITRNGNFLTVEWPRDPSRAYVIQWTTDPVTFADVPAAKLSGERMNIVDVTGLTRVFVRLRVAR